MPLPPFDQARMGQRKPEYLIWAALCQAMNIESYVELGTGSAFYLHLAGVPRVIAVDINHAPDRHNPFEYEGVKYLLGDSHDPRTLDRVLTELDGPPDAVFIDADHSYAAARADFDLWWPRAKRLVGFHDIQIPDVARLWREISLGIPSASIIGCDFASAVSWQGPTVPADAVLSAGGIGVLFKE